MELQRVQQRLLVMGKTIAEVLERNNIPYMITFGTLLGAVRHKGFIPWDDDFDMFLFDESYDKAMEVLSRELPPDMFLETKDTEPLYFHGFAHVKDIKTITICSQFPHDGLYEHKGLSIDLYRAVRMDEGLLDKFLITEHIAYLGRRLNIDSIDKDIYAAKVKKLEEQLHALQVKETGKDILAMALAERSMKIEHVFPLKKISFEDTEFYGPADADGLLTAFYGNYMQLPTVEHRVPHYDNVIFIEAQ